jgi:ubiquinone/menaquinone biosynthesis C-methylase UbiE
VAAAVGMEARAQAPPRMATKSAPAVRGAAAPGAKIPSATAEINAKFKDPELDVQDWRRRFESDSREVYAARQQVLAACHIQPGDRVADVGAGTGFYTLLFAKAVGPDGWVVPVEVSTKFLEFLNQRATQQGVTNITPVLGSDRSINLPPNSLNLVFICDTYHHFEYPQEILASIHRSLRDGGALVIVDYERIPGKSSAWTLGHVRAGKEGVRREIEAAGFEFVEEVKIPKFRETYFLRFRKTG